MGQRASGETSHSGQDGSSMDCCDPGTNGCFAIMREHKSRFYIARKCLVMLLCWHKHGIVQLPFTHKSSGLAFYGYENIKHKLSEKGERKLREALYQTLEPASMVQRIRYLYDMVSLMNVFTYAMLWI